MPTKPRGYCFSTVPFLRGEAGLPVAGLRWRRAKSTPRSRAKAVEGGELLSGGRRSPRTFMASWFPRRADGAARLARLLLEAHEEVHDLAGVGAAVEAVPGLDEVGAASDPARLAVDEGGVLEDGQELAKVAVHVAHGHDALDLVPRVLRTGPGSRAARRSTSKEAPGGRHGVPWEARGARGANEGVAPWP
jgi:hypothetical protein